MSRLASTPVLVMIVLAAIVALMGCSTVSTEATKSDREQPSNRRTHSRPTEPTLEELFELVLLSGLDDDQLAPKLEEPTRNVFLKMKRGRLTPKAALAKLLQLQSPHRAECLVVWASRWETTNATSGYEDQVQKLAPVIEEVRSSEHIDRILEEPRRRGKPRSLPVLFGGDQDMLESMLLLNGIYLSLVAPQVAAFGDDRSLYMLCRALGEARRIPPLGNLASLEGHKLDQDLLSKIIRDRLSKEDPKRRLVMLAQRYVDD